MDVNDGKYVGELTPEQVIEQYEFRAGIHASYLDRLEEGDRNYLLGLPDIPTAIAFHEWAINGYEWGMKYVRENNPVVYKCSFGEAIGTIIRKLLLRG